MTHCALVHGLIERFDLQSHSIGQYNFYEVDNKDIEKLITILKIRFPELHIDQENDCYYIDAETHSGLNWIVNMREPEGEIQNWNALDVKVINDAEVGAE